jgi:cobyrinic acid a,c-diamide synthase
MSFSLPRIVLAALKGGSGKTLLALGLVSSWKDRGFRVAPFKKGPDFIDAGWLSFAADRPCRNLDHFMMTNGQIIDSFVSYSKGLDVSVVEGNRGLYDGLDIEGSCSTAELAKLLNAPVIIVVDVTMATRTVGAIVMGCQVFDRELNIRGVILNRVAGSRQEKIIRNSIEKYCGLKVLGSIPKLKKNLFPERHMGLVPFQEREHSEKSISWAREAIEKGLDLDSVMDIAQSAGEITADIKEERLGRSLGPQDRPRIGYILDKSFWFYYPENLEILERMGADLIKVDSIFDDEIPPLDALYIGGGFPECQAGALAENNSFRVSLKDNIERGLPVYAECGGLIYLGNSLNVDGRRYEMVGALPIDFFLEKKPQGHGYTVLEVERENPFYPVGAVLKGHEFHYSRAVAADGGENLVSVFSVKRGNGVDGVRDGVSRKNLLGTYTHIHAGGNTKWAEGIFKASLKFKKK